MHFVISSRMIHDVGKVTENEIEHNMELGLDIKMISKESLHIAVSEE